MATQEQIEANRANAQLTARLALHEIGFVPSNLGRASRPGLQAAPAPSPQTRTQLSNPLILHPLPPKLASFRQVPQQPSHNPPRPPAPSPRHPLPSPFHPPLLDNWTRTVR
jgi:hypothetical protein